MAVGLPILQRAPFVVSDTKKPRIGSTITKSSFHIQFATPYCKVRFYDDTGIEARPCINWLGLVAGLYPKLSWCDDA